MDSVWERRSVGARSVWLADTVTPSLAKWSPAPGSRANLVLSYLGSGARARKTIAGVAAVVACAMCTPASARSPAPRTIATFPGVVRAFDYEAARIAWIDSAWVLRGRSVRSGAESATFYTNPYEEIPAPGSVGRLVLGESRLLWVSTRGTGMFEEADHVYTAEIGAAKGQRLTTEEHGDGSDGAYVTGLAGDRGGFSFGSVVVEAVGADKQSYQVTGGGVWSVVKGVPHRLSGAPPAYVAARSSGRVALRPVSRDVRPAGTPIPAGPVEVRNATTGASISRFDPGAVRSLAMNAAYVAVLTGRRIVLYDVHEGRLAGSTRVPADTAADIVVAGQFVVFHTQSGVHILDPTSGWLYTLATTKAPWKITNIAADLSTIAWVESRRVAAGEPARRTFVSRVRTVPAP